MSDIIFRWKETERSAKENEEMIMKKDIKVGDIHTYGEVNYAIVSIEERDIYHCLELDNGILRTEKYDLKDICDDMLVEHFDNSFEAVNWLLWKLKK